MQNSAQDTNLTNCQENSYQTVCETLGKRQKKQKNKCATLERNKQSTEHIQNSARGTNVTNSPTEHV